MPPTEKDLDFAFAASFQNSAEFQHWLLLGGRFATHAGSARLLAQEMALTRGMPDHWWRHCWCKLPDGSESETDLLFVFEATSKRFAIHIENKPVHGKLTFEQAAGYRPRAAFMANDSRWLAYTDFETVLLAPSEFITKNQNAISQFDRSVTYEEVAKFAPLFAQTIHG